MSVFALPVLLESPRTYAFGLLTEAGVFKVADLAHKWGKSEARTECENFKQSQPIFAVAAVGADAIKRIKEMDLWDALILKMAEDMHYAALGPEKARQRKAAEVLSAYPAEVSRIYGKVIPHGIQ